MECESLDEIFGFGDLPEPAEDERKLAGQPVVDRSFSRVTGSVRVFTAPPRIPKGWVESGADELERVLGHPSTWRKTSGTGSRASMR